MLDQNITDLGPASLFNEIRRWLIVYGQWRDPEPAMARVTALQHACQAATRAEADGGSTDDIVAALLHDAARPLAGERAGEVMATVLRGKMPRQHLLALNYLPEFRGDILNNTDRASRFVDESWWTTALHLARWDVLSYDPNYVMRPLSAFAERLLNVCER